jgi:glycosyltransferase involved in cell wall biosynthesis
LRADTVLKGAAWAAAPAALAAGWFKAMRVARKRRATVMHAHWVIPSGVTAALAAPSLPLVVSLHGSDVYVAEQHGAARRAAQFAFARAAWITACSEDLRRRAIALGARHDATEVVPYGVDGSRFAPNQARRHEVRHDLGVGSGPLVVSAGRLVRKKGFEYLIGAAALLREEYPSLIVAIAGDGDLRAELASQAASAGNVRLLGACTQDQIAGLLAAADAAVVPSVHDESGNVDGLPNFALEAVAAATPVVATPIGGLPQLVLDGQTGRLVPERDPRSLASALRDLLNNPPAAHALGLAGRDSVLRHFGWSRVAERFEAAYSRATQ